MTEKGRGLIRRTAVTSRTIRYITVALALTLLGAAARADTLPRT
jgi:hypothetical protein